MNNCRVFSIVVCLTYAITLFAQDLNLREVKTPVGIFSGFVGGMAQDKSGFIWLASKGGLIRYDGYSFKKFAPKENSDFRLETIYIDHQGVFWLPAWLNGLYRYDPVRDSFTHFKHDPLDSKSISEGYVRAVTEDNDSILWIGTHGGLNRFDRSSNTFIKYVHNFEDAQSISSNIVRVIYNDKQGSLWIGTGSSWPGEGTPEDGGLNRMDKKSGKFIRYVHDPASPFSLSNNKVQALFEDNKGVFWIGTGGDGLHTLDRNTGKITRHPYDPRQPKKLSRTEPKTNVFPPYISFINEDAKGNIWIGTLDNGFTVFNPSTQIASHYPAGPNGPANTWSCLNTSDGNLFISTFSNSLFKLDVLHQDIPFFPVDANITAIRMDTSQQLWIGTDNGLMVRNIHSGVTRTFIHQNENPNSLSNNLVNSIHRDRTGTIWIGTRNGLNRYDPVTRSFKRFLYQLQPPPFNSQEININSISDSHSDSMWVALNDLGLVLMDKNTGRFRHFVHDPLDSQSLSGNFVSAIINEPSGNLWVGTWIFKGLNYLDIQSGKVYRFLPNSSIADLFYDSSGNIWVSTDLGVFKKTKARSDFIKVPLKDDFNLNEVFGKFLEDHERNIWVTTFSGIIKIKQGNSPLTFYKLNANPMSAYNNSAFMDEEGDLYIRTDHGYYVFPKEGISINPIAPQIVITDLIINKKSGGESENFFKHGIKLDSGVKLKYNQNTFKFYFTGIHYSLPEANLNYYKLENHDQEWQPAQDSRTANYYNLQPGKYLFRVKAISNDGIQAEQSIPVRIFPPWWLTWWAYTIYALLFIFSIRWFINYRSQALKNENLELEKKVTHRTAELNSSLEKLKATQSQLVQSEKMASLGELTAGIAHEIQNPLNFVNNFSEINADLLDELKNEINEKNETGLHLLASLKENEYKILQHGKRADAIVKGMLQHSQKSSGVKEPTNINALAEEYYRLAYHSYISTLSKEKLSTEIKLITDLDDSLPLVNVIPQDIGRVLLNLYHNAFWFSSVALAKEEFSSTKATEDKSDLSTGNAMKVETSSDAIGFGRRLSAKDRFLSSDLSTNNAMKVEALAKEGTITLITKNLGDRIEIRIRDNGPGIPPNIMDKIFQPFFTTKPAGQGTGLGLSLAYDIVTKGHNGTLKVSSEEGQGSEFIIQLPV